MTTGSTSTALGSVLFVPGDRDDLAAKALRNSPDAIVLDLEDAVAPTAKARARGVARSQAWELATQSQWTQVFVRVNSPATEWFGDDVRNGVPPGVGIVVPKCESRADIEETLRSALEVDATAPRVIAGIETARGLTHVEDIAGAEVAALYFGAEDYIADMAGRRTRQGFEVLYARSRVVHAARAAGTVALDQVVVDTRDDARFREECREALSMGYSGKLCIHPRQVELVHDVFDPTEEEIEWARDVVAAHAEAEREGSGVTVVGGRMIDHPLVIQARIVLERAARAEQRSSPGSGSSSPLDSRSRPS